MEELKYPLTVNKIEFKGQLGFRKPLFHETGGWVSIRPCDEKYGNKTYLGVLLGEIPLSLAVGVTKETGELTIMPSFENPAIYVPDLKKVIMGCESWWGEIESPEALREIKDIDIENVWYLRALNELIKQAEAKKQQGKETPIEEKPEAPKAE